MWLPVSIQCLSRSGVLFHTHSSNPSDNILMLCLRWSTHRQTDRGGREEELHFKEKCESATQSENSLIEGRPFTGLKLILKQKNKSLIFFLSLSLLSPSSLLVLYSPFFRPFLFSHYILIALFLFDIPLFIQEFRDAVAYWEDVLFNETAVGRT